MAPPLHKLWMVIHMEDSNWNELSITVRAFTSKYVVTVVGDSEEQLVEGGDW